MRLTASRPTLILTAFGIAAACVALQWGAGFRVSDEAGRSLEMVAVVGYMAAAIILLSPLGRGRALPAAALATILVAGAVYLNTEFATALDIRFGGPYPWSGQRRVVAALVVGPFAGVVTGILVLVLARIEAIRWSGKSYAT